MNGDIDSFLNGKSVIYLDTCPLIYFIEENPAYLQPVKEIIGKIDSGECQGASSLLTLIEVLVNPLKKGAMDIVAQYKDALLNGPIKLHPIGEELANKAAEIRAKYGMKIPDAIQISTAIHIGADVFVTNDYKLKKVSEIHVLYLGDFIAIPSSGKSQSGGFSSWFKNLFN